MGELGGTILERVLAKEDVPDDEAGTAEQEEGDEDENYGPQDREKPNGAFGVPDRDHRAIVGDARRRHAGSGVHGPCWARTSDLEIKSLLLYQLS